MEALKKNLDFLKAFRGMSEEQQLLVLRNATKEQVKVIGDIAINILRKNIRLTAKDKKRLIKYKDFIRVIGVTETSQSNRLQTVRVNPRGAIELILTTLQKLIRISKA